MVMRYRKSFRLGKGRYLSQSYSGNDAIVAAGVDASLSLFAGLAQIAALLLRLVVGVVVELIGLVVAVAVSAILTLFRAVFRLAAFLGGTALRLVGRAPSALVSLADSLGEGVCSVGESVGAGARAIGPLEPRIAKLRLKATEGGKALASVYRRLPDWGQPIVWGVFGAVPAILVLVVSLRLLGH